jgi:hypothetical protein
MGWLLHGQSNQQLDRLMFTLLDSVLIAAEPVQKIGSCPLGYYTQGSYCVPSQINPRPAIERYDKQCPLGWYTNGNYCIKS